MDLLVSGEDSQQLVLHFYGKLDQSFKSSLEEHVASFSKYPAVEFDLSGVEDVEDIAVLYWVRLLDGLPNNCSLHYSKCSPAVVATFNSVPELVKKAQVNSVLFAARCRLCENDFSIQVDEQDFSKAQQTVDDSNCDKCFAKDFEPIELVDIYFGFLKA